jgi:caffeoyl-CoA O-methyltransferase
MSDIRTLPVTSELIDYVVDHGSFPVDEVLADLHDETVALGSAAGMQIGPDQGQLLTLLTRLVGARRAVEVGTFTGYSSLCIARGLAPAVETLRTLPATADIDLVFIDADKPGYPTYWDELVPRVRSGGLLLADNVLWSGNIHDPAVDDRNARALRSFNDQVAADDRVEAVILPAFDGLTIARKR